MGLLLVIGVFLEMLGLGVLIPALKLIVSPNIVAEYPFLRPYLEAIGNPPHNQLVVCGLILLVSVYLLKLTYIYFVIRKQSLFSAELSSDLSERLLSGYLHIEYTFHLQRNSAQLMRNVLSEVNVFTATSQAFILLSTEISGILGVLFVILAIEPVGGIIVISFLTLASVCFHLGTRSKLLKWGTKRQEYEGEATQHLVQGISGIKEVKLMGREEAFLKKFSERNFLKAIISAKQSTLQQVPRLYLEFLSVLGLAILIVFMMSRSASMDTILPVLGVFVAGAFRMMPAVNRIMGAIQFIRYSEPAISLLHEEFSLIKNTERETTPPTDTHNFSFNDSITLTNINFCYPGAEENAIRNLSLSIKKGESIGFVGSSGSGKSTLIDIILGLLTPVSGQVLIDTKDIQRNLCVWQSKIGYVPQTIYLTDDTLRNNVAFGINEDQIDEEQVKKAIKAAQLEDFVAAHGAGLDMFVGERGVRLSGGQRQRIGIARALYNDPAVLVLDEATSSLDSVTEQGVMEAVNALHASKTIIIVAHRLSTVDSCDKLFKLSKGQIVEVKNTD